VATVAEVFAQAWQRHQAGNLPQAEQLYRQILQEDPSHADAWCFLGAACQAQGRLAEAESHFRKAVQLLPGHPSAQNCLGVLLANQGKLDEAAASFQMLIDFRPADAEAHNNLGLVRANQGRWDQAIAGYRRALQLRPDFAAARTNLAQALQRRNTQSPPPPAPAASAVAHGAEPTVQAANQRGVTFAQQGRLDEASKCFQQALQLQPDNADAYNNMGIVLDLQHKHDEAIRHYRRALELRPNLVATYYNLAIVLHKVGQLDEAIASFQQALHLKPDHVDAYNNLAIVLMDKDRLDEAIACCRKALQVDPKHPGAYCNLGNIFQRQNKLDEAARCYEEALRLNPKFAEACNNLAKTFQDQRQWGPAVEYYERALELNPNFAEAHYNLGNALRDLGKLEDAVAKYRHTIRLKPEFPFAHNNLGDALLKQGRPDLAAASFRQALLLKPDLTTAQSNLLFCMNYDPQVDPDVVFAEHCRWGRLHPPPSSPKAHANDRHPERRLRIGYISPDFRFHPLTRYFEPVLAHHDPKQVEVFCYADVLFPDPVTNRLQKLAQGWRSICHQSAAQIAEQISQDRIDILVDLAGHTANNHLCVFALRPAPVQATWLGYMNTTGLAAMDYRLTDAVLDPPGHPLRDTEELVRLSAGMCCFGPPADAPAVAALPAQRSSHLTFGALHNLFKLNAAVFELWSQVLKAVPDSRLLIYRDTMTTTAQEHIRKQFAERGIGEQRLDLRVGGCGPGYLGIFNDIDVSLDAFPCTGGVTTCESLWMGVPVVSLCGVRPASRNSAGILTRVGLADWAVQTPDQYLALCARAAGGLEELAELRAGLRARMAETLCDGRGFTVVLEDAYRTMWRRWCDDQGRRNNLS
jgi:protein O-GlcNAc transferase